MMTHKILAAGSVALMGAGALVGASPAFAYTFTDADCDALAGPNIMSSVDTSNPNFDAVCTQIAFGPSDVTFTPPANLEELQVAIIGGGGGASHDAYGYGGNGGGVMFIDGLEPTQSFVVTIGDGGDPGQDGENTVLTAGTDVYSATGGDAGANNYTYSGNDWESSLASDNNSWHGAGAAGDATADGPGDGRDLDDPDLITEIVFTDSVPVARAYTNPLHTAWMSNAAPFFAPSLACTRQAVAGIL